MTMDAEVEVADEPEVASAAPAAAPEPPPFVPGAFPDMPAEVYHAVEAMSSSGVAKMLKSPAHYRLMRTQSSPATDAMRFGTAVHCGVLEPDAFDARVSCAPKADRRTKDGKAAWAKFQADSAGRIILAKDAYDRARRCVDAVRAHPAAARLFDGAEVELSLFWHDAKYRVPCKARLDARNHGGIIDLKTTTDASPEEFAKTIANYSYHAQGAHYASGAEHVLDASPAFFAIVAVESEPPHAVACYALPGNAMLAGGYLVNRALERYAAALAAGEWPGYPATVESITLPPWATRFNH